MILVASPAKPLLYTVKGTLRRQATLAQYKNEIDAAYAIADASAQEGVEAPSEWSPMSIKDLVRRAVEKTMKNRQMIKEDMDLFEWGLDRCISYSILGSQQYNLVPSVYRQPGYAIRC